MHYIIHLQQQQLIRRIANPIPLMKPRPQHPQTLLVTKLKLLSTSNRTYLTKIDRTLMIDLNGGRLFSCASTNVSNSLNKEKSLNTLQSLEKAVSNFGIFPDTDVYHIGATDTGMDQYLKQLGIAREKGESICLYCNSKEGVMFPLFFETRQACLKFHAAVLVYQLYHKYYPGFSKLCEVKGLPLSVGMNMRLLEGLAQCLVAQDIIIDPQWLSTVEVEQFQLQIIKDSIQRVSKRSNTLHSRISVSSSKPPSSNNLSQQPTLFSLRLHYKLVDSISLSYLSALVPPQIMRTNVRELFMRGCSINDRILAIMLRVQDKGMVMGVGIQGLMYKGLVKLDLSNNQLTDLCFGALGAFIGYAPQLSDLCLGGNLIKLQSLSALRKDEKQNARLSTIRMSNIRVSKSRMSVQGAPNLLNKNQPLFIQFLLNLQHRPLNYLNLDSNLISDPEVLVSYLIEGQNVPVRYISVKNNKICEVDKIRMAKLVVSEVRERGDHEQMAILDFGAISVVDEDVYKYVMLVRDKGKELGLEEEGKGQPEEPDRRRSTNQIKSLSSLDLKRIQASQPNVLKVCLTLNKEWEMCDQDGILQISNLYRNRRKTTNRKSQIISNILMGSSLSPSNSSASLKKDEKPTEVEHLTPETVKSTVLYLKQAYVDSNYSAIHIYKHLLKQYNLELYNKKIAPMFIKYQKNLQEQQQAIIARLEELSNFHTTKRQGNISKYGKPIGTEELNEKLDGLIAKLFMKRVDNQVKPSILLYEGQIGEELQIQRPFTSNVFTYLIYLREKRDSLIEKMIAEGYNPMVEISNKFRKSQDLYADYYLAHPDWLCYDNYEDMLNNIIKQKQEIKRKQSLVLQKQVNELIREKYLIKCRNSGRNITQQYQFSWEQRQFCFLEPKLMFTGFLIRFYIEKYISNKKQKRNGIIPFVQCQLQVISPTVGRPISEDVSNFLDFVSRNDMLTAPPLCINPNIPPNELPTCETLKFSLSNPTFEASLQKFSQLVIAFIKFLHHSPQKVLPETLQYLNYLINTVLSQEDPYNIESMGSQFFIQLFTYNAHVDADSRARQVDVGILATVVEFASFYMPYTEMLEKYIQAHVLKAQMTVNKLNKKSKCRILGPRQPRFTRKEDQLPAEIVTHIFSPNQNTNQFINGLIFPIEIYHTDQQSNEGELAKTIINVHILSKIEDIYRQVQKLGLHKKFVELGSHQSEGQVARGNCNWALFLQDLQTHKTFLLVPSSTQITTLYTLFRKSVLSPYNPQKRLRIKHLLASLSNHLAQYTNQLQIHFHFKQVYKAFRDYGSYLPLIENKESMHIVNIIVECILCEILLAQKERLMEIVHGQEAEVQGHISHLSESYASQLQSYCPKDTASTLSSQQRLYIEDQISKQLKIVITKLQKVEQYYSQILQKHLAQFQSRCRLISYSTAIWNQISQQQILFTSHGLVHINKIIYVQALYWSMVYDIVVKYEPDETTIKGIQIHYQNQIGSQKIINITGLANNEDKAIFMNACLFMIRNVSLLFLRTGPDRLYRHISSIIRLQQEIVFKNRQKIEESKLNLPSIWSQLTSTINYVQTVDKKPQKIYQPIIQSQIPKKQTKIKEPVIQQNVMIENNAKKQQNQVIPKAQPAIQEIPLNQIVNKVDEIKQENEENVVVTTARRSSRRELPRRRSSREK